MTTTAIFIASAAMISGTVRPVIATSPVEHDADDPALWIAPDPSRSFILGTDKDDEGGSLYAFDLRGRVRQRVTGLRRPNNVDVVQGVVVGGRIRDFAVISERGRQRLRFFEIHRKTGSLTDVTGKTAVFERRKQKDAVPMGVAFLKRGNRVPLVVVSPKSGPRSGYLSACRLAWRDDKIDIVSGSDFGLFSGDGEIESVCTDATTGAVYFADEGWSLRRTLGVGNGQPLTQDIESTGYKGDREGLAIYSTGRASGFLLSSDQVLGGSYLHIYDRRSPNARLAIVATASDETDGIDATSTPLGARYPQGIVVMMNSKGRCYDIYDWRDIARAASLPNK